MKRLKRFIQIFLFLLSAVFVFDLLRATRLIAESSQIIKETKKFERSLTNAPINILILGDSTAVGTGALRAEDSIAGRFGQDYPLANIVNRGMNGLKTKQLLDQLSLKEEKFNLVVLQIGGNDIIRFTPLPSLKEDIHSLLKAIKKKSPNIILLHSGNVGLAPIFPRFLQWLWTQRTRQVRAFWQQAALLEGAFYVDLFKERKEDLFLQNVGQYYSKDMLHPSSSGYGWWYQRIRETMQQANIKL